MQGADAEGVVAVIDQIAGQARRCLKGEGIDVVKVRESSLVELPEILAKLSQSYVGIFVHVGHDSGLVDGDIERALGRVGPERRVVWATIAVPEPTDGRFNVEDRTNVSIRSVMGHSSSWRVLDWRQALARHPDWIDGDWVMTQTGCAAYARKITKLMKVVPSPRPRR